MWRHYFTRVLIPEVKLVSTMHNMRTVEGLPMRQLLRTDGEACILNEAFDPEVLAAFKDALIDYLKLGPSSTREQQEWDKWILFRDTKGGIKDVLRNGTLTEDAEIRRSLTQYFIEFANEFPNIKLTSKFKEKATSAIMLVIFAIRAQMTSNKMQQAFIETGFQKNGVLMPGDETVDFKKMLLLCGREVTTAEFNHMDGLKEIVGLRGLRDGTLLYRIFNL